MAKEKYYGHLTRKDGSHKALSESEAQKIWEAVEHDRAVREHSMPSSVDALSIIVKAKQRLRDLGWSDGCYCPKDGTPFAAIEFGSTGIFTGSMTEEWPYGFADIEDCGQHPDGFMWKAIDKLTDEENAARIQSGIDTTNFIERQLESFAQMDARPNTPEGET